MRNTEEGSIALNEIKLGKNVRRVEYLEHLNEEFGPIVVYIIGADNTGRHALEKQAEEVDYDPKTDYTISPIDARPKFTRGLANCTSLVVAGIDSETGKNISFLTHQDDLGSHNDDTFLKELKTKLEEMRKRCIKESVDAVLVGGSFAHRIREQKYVGTVRTIANLMQQEIGFNPYVAVGPKLGASDDNVYYDTQEKKLYVYRGEYNENDTSNAGYGVDQLDELTEIWRRDREKKKLIK